MKMIIQSLNMHLKHTYISWHNHVCLPRMLTYQTLILLIFYFIDETYDHVNHMHLIHCHHFYMNGISIFLSCYQDQMNLENIQQKYLPLIIVYFHPNVDSIFQYGLIR